MLGRQFIALGLLSLALLGPASAASISFVPTTTTSLAPGGSVTFEIYGTSVNDIGAFSLYLNSTGTGSQFQLTAYAINTSLFEDISLDLPQSISTTEDSQDLGSFSTDTPPLLANTQYLLGTATVTSSPLTPLGNYYLGNAVTTVFTDSTFTQSDYAPESTLLISIVAIPEPSTWSALIVGALGCAILARRRKAGAR